MAVSRFCGLFKLRKTQNRCLQFVTSKLSQDPKYIIFKLPGYNSEKFMGQLLCHHCSKH